MRSYKKNKQNKILLGGLLATVLVMAIGYATFATRLNITGTSNISSNWNIKITNIRGLDACEYRDEETGVYKCLTEGEASDTTPPTYDNVNGLTASFSTSLKKPGDKRTYEVEISNLGNFDAQITKTLTDNTNNPAINITYLGVRDKSLKETLEYYDDGYYSNLDLSEEEPFDLPAKTNNKKYVYISVEYDSNVTSQPTNLTASATLTLNATQKSSNYKTLLRYTNNSTFTGTIYRNNSNILYNGKSIDGTILGYCIVGDDYNSCDDGSVLEDEETCTSELQFLDAGNTYTCESGSVILNAGSYETDASKLNKNYYLKHDVVNGIVEASYVCFVYDGNEHCMKGGDNNVTSFNDNMAIIQGYKTYYNLGDYDEETGLGCGFDSNYVYFDSLYFCGDSGFHLDASSDGFVGAVVYDSGHCSVDTDGSTRCGEWVSVTQPIY